jgi:hypothetical protein
MRRDDGGGFELSANFIWQSEGAIGYEVTPHIFVDPD